MKNNPIYLLCYAFLELNSIRARYGAPEGVCPKYFSGLVDDIDNYITQETGHSAHCNPILFRSKNEISDT